jgi:histone deacetylase complex subunit SAP30
VEFIIFLPYFNKLTLSFHFQMLMKHFKTIPVVEKEALTFFIYMVKSNSNKLDQKNGISADAT